MSMPTAFTTAMLAWGLVSFGPGYGQEEGAQLKVQKQVVWGADYLLKTLKPNGQGFNLIYQVRAEEAYTAMSKCFSSLHAAINCMGGLCNAIREYGAVNLLDRKTNSSRYVKNETSMLFTTD